MDYKTHITVGAAAAVCVMSPNSITEAAVISSVGAMSGLFPDIDSKGSKSRHIADTTVLVTAALVNTARHRKGLSGMEIISQVFDRTNPGFLVSLGLAGLILIYILGIRSPHRSFTHSLLCLSLCTAFSYLSLGPLWLPFLTGYLSHLAIDILNKKGEMLLYPLGRRFCLNVCRADGAVNTLLLFVAAGIWIWRMSNLFL